MTTPDSGPLLKSVELPQLTPQDDLLIQVAAAAICRTDLYAAEGHLPVSVRRILGHEFSGIVSEVWSTDSPFAEGDRVVGNPVFSCGKCRDCTDGQTHLCSNTEFLGIDRDGAFAEYVKMPSSNVVPIPAELSFPVATFFEPVAAGLAVLEAGLDRKDAILLHGSSRISKLTARILDEFGFQNYIVSDSVPEKEFDAVIETTGITGKMELLISTLRPGGKLIVKSREPVNAEFPVLEAIRKRITIQAVRYGSFEDALPFLIKHQDFLKDLLDDDWELANFEEAFKVSKRSESRKVCFQLIR